MSIRRAILFLKPFDAYPVRIYESISGSGVTNPKILQYAEDRLQVHKDAISFCQDVLKRKLIDWETFSRDGLSKSVQSVDLVVSIGGDGTLLQASHLMDGSIPILGVNSNPTQVKEVEEFSNEFDAARSTGYLCAATVENFEQVLDDILESDCSPSELSRMSISINSQRIPTPALNDILVAHPCPAAVSRFSFRFFCWSYQMLLCLGTTKSVNSYWIHCCNALCWRIHNAYTVPGPPVHGEGANLPECFRPSLAARLD